MANIINLNLTLDLFNLLFGIRKESDIKVKIIIIFVVIVATKG